MSTLVEIAEKADVAVEGVVRVLTKRSVSTAVSERVLAVLDQLDDEQAQVVERFALAAIPDVLPPEAAPANGVPGGPLAPAKAAALQLEGSLVEAGAALARSEGEPVRSTNEDQLVAQLGALLQELVDSLAQLQRQGAALRQDRIADLAVLVDLISSTSEGVDRRLGRLEQMVGRLEAPRR
jgi:predicted component of type VI protein secretion system